MEYLTLNNGMQMPLLGFGTWDVRGDSGKRSILDALELGYRLIDTARMYENEAMVGAAMRESGLDRAELFLTTKLHRLCADYHSAKAGIECSLNELQTDYIDLLLIHEPYEHALEMYQAMQEAYQQGKVKALGISNFNAAEYSDFLCNCGLVPAVNQVESHVYHTQLTLQNLLQKNGTQMQSWAPFTQGRRNLFAEPALNRIGTQYQKTAAQVALRFLVQHHIAVIPKSVHRVRMAENFAIFDFELSQEDIAQIACLDEACSLFGWY